MHLSISLNAITVFMEAAHENKKFTWRLAFVYEITLNLSLNYAHHR
jgi:hypothetical protein